MTFNPMTWAMQSIHAAVVAVCIWATTLAAGPATAQQPDSATINGTFIMSPGGSGISPDLAEIVARGESHTWTLTLEGLSYSHDDDVLNNNPYDFYARSITRVYATSFDFQFQGPGAVALNAIISDRLVNGGLQNEPFVELRNVTYFDPDWGELTEARDWVIAITPLDYQQGFRFFSIPASLEYPPYTVDANGYPVLEPFTSGFYGAWVQITDLRPGYAGAIGTYGGNTISVSLPRPGDFNHDGTVNGADLDQWQGDFGLNALSDADRDNDSDGTDFLAWQRQLGAGPSATVASTAVPEPATFVLMIVAAAGWCQRRRRTA